MAQGQPTDATELFAEQKQDLGEGWHDTFDALTAQGRAPSSIKATIEYVTTGKTQDQAAREFNTSTVTIRKLQAAVVALGPVDGVKGNEKHGLTALECCTHVADRFGWEEGTEYTVHDNGPNNTPSPHVLKKGWLSLYEHVTE